LIEILLFVIPIAAILLSVVVYFLFGRKPSKEEEEQYIQEKAGLKVPVSIQDLYGQAISGMLKIVIPAMMTPMVLVNILILLTFIGVIDPLTAVLIGSAIFVVVFLAVAALYINSLQSTSGRHYLNLYWNMDLEKGFPAQWELDGDPINIPIEWLLKNVETLKKQFKTAVEK